MLISRGVATSRSVTSEKLRAIAFRPLRSSFRLKRSLHPPSIFRLSAPRLLAFAKGYRDRADIYGHSRTLQMRKAWKLQFEFTVMRKAVSTFKRVVRNRKWEEVEQKGEYVVAVHVVSIPPLTEGDGLFS